MMKDALKFYLATALLFLVLPQDVMAKSKHGARKPLAVASPEEVLRTHYEKEFSELHLTGETSFCAPTAEAIASTAKTLAYEISYKVEIEKTKPTCAHVTLDLTSDLEKDREIYHDDLIALHKTGGVRIYAREGLGGTEGEMRQLLIRKIGRIAREIALGESVQSLVETELTRLPSDAHDRKECHRVLCASIKLSHFDPRHRSPAYERWLAGSSR